MKVEFDIKITAADLYDYMLAHTYSGFSGIFGGVVGALLIVLWFNTNMIYYLAAGIVILLYIPCSLFLRAKRQAANESFKEHINYILTDEGVTVTQGEAEMTQPWAAIMKASSTNKSLLLYTSKVNAWIFPKRQLGDKREDVIMMISTHVSPDRVKIKQ